MTEQRLANIALYYLQRYAASAERLRQVLRRRVQKAARVHDTDQAQADQWIAALVERYQRSGLLDDVAFARARATRDWRAGRPLRAIRQRLKLAGVAPCDIDTAIAALRENLSAPELDPDLLAAIHYARRRRLGPFGAPDQRADRRTRDLAAMARAGFAYAVASRIIDAEDPMKLEDIQNARR